MGEVSRVEAVFLEAVGRADHSERAAYLQAACGEDANLRSQVEKLLAAYPQMGRFLEMPAIPGESNGIPAVGLDPNATISHPTARDLNTTKDLVGENPGKVIAGKYKLLELIGEGGMGSVWRAKQTEPVTRYVALKLIKQGMDSKQVLARFEAERQALAMMDHPNIAKILDGGIHEGRPFFVMELVKGTPITEFCDARRLTPQQRLELFLPICLAIQHAHQKGIIHRDIKPSNVLIALYDDKPVPKVIDFGVAKATGGALTPHTLDTGFGAVVGTPQYMSPEQATFNNLDIDTRSDVYSLGTLLYELLAGSPPFARPELEKRGLLEILRVVREEEPPRPSIKLSTAQARASISANRGTEPGKLSAWMKGEIDWIVMKALEKDRTRRYESANGLAADVRRYLNGDAVEACPPSLTYQMRKFASRHKAQIASGIAVALAILVGVAGTVWQAAERRREREMMKLQSIQAASSAMDRALAALQANRLTEVDAALSMIDHGQLGNDSHELIQRMELIRKDRDTLRELETIYEEYWTVCPGNTTRDPERAKARYPDLFHKYGIPVGELAITTAKERVKASLIAPALIDGLGTWFFLNPKVEGLRPLLDRLDPDEFRVTVRAAVAADNNDRLQELAKKADPALHPPVFSVMLAGRVSDPENYRILTASWRRHPDSFAVVLALAFPEVGSSESRERERVGWCRMAISLRPNNALAHYYFGLQYYWDRTESGLNNRIAALQRAIELAPHFANAHAQLGWALHDADRNEEAISSLVRATEIDTNNIPGHAGLCLIYLLRKDWVRAAKKLKTLSPLSEPDDDFCQSSYAISGVRAAYEVLEKQLQKGLIRQDRFNELVELYTSSPRNSSSRFDPEDIGDDQLNIANYLPSCAAVQASVGRGIDPPLPMERPRVRRLALDWLSSDLDACERKLCEEERLSPLVYRTMKKWLVEPLLADVRGDRINELPLEEQEEWRQVWANVRRLQVQTASWQPPILELAPLPRWATRTSTP